jgi:hypothetical protein
MASANVLSKKVRPEVEFDVKNSEHRRLYSLFLNTHSWGHSPIRFITRPSYGIDKGVIDRKLLEYYTNKEFSNQDNKIDV